jgi:anti-sigma28 factor (negative regulator of flagellin synthesis)
MGSCLRWSAVSLKCWGEYAEDVNGRRPNLGAASAEDEPMKITNEHVASLLGARLDLVGRAQKTEIRPAGGTAEADRALFSLRSEDVRAGMAAARAAGLSDEARLAALGGEVRAGKYRVPSEAIAEALFRDLGR